MQTKRFPFPYSPPMRRMILNRQFKGSLKPLFDHLGGRALASFVVVEEERPRLERKGKGEARRWSRGKRI